MNRTLTLLSSLFVIGFALNVISEQFENGRLLSLLGLALIYLSVLIIPVIIAGSSLLNKREKNKITDANKIEKVFFKFGLLVLVFAVIYSTTPSSDLADGLGIVLASLIILVVGVIALFVGIYNNRKLLYFGK